MIALTDPNGYYVESYEYDVFGVPTIYDYATQQMVEQSTVGNPYFFTRRRLDPMLTRSSMSFQVLNGYGSVTVS